ncbi:hypothetical protein [Variovorax guangxiensis]|uniref:hypothetical protein n=1 Tax=Variovorax guangxiensis TaxID=1775474 RepID=UPI00285D129A|nr:hypothetical protein [Variovorax guangxiensis]MDR6854853.1 ribosomal protein L16 Arg81 hydroxylase [Variovorax guangxiensis]
MQFLSSVGLRPPNSALLLSSLSGAALAEEQDAHQNAALLYAVLGDHRLAIRRLNASAP